MRFYRVVSGLFLLSVFLALPVWAQEGAVRLTWPQIMQMAEPSVIVGGPSLLLALLAKYVTWVKEWGTWAKRGFVIGGSVLLALLFMRSQGSLGLETVSAVFAAVAGLLAGITTTTTVAVMKSEPTPLLPQLELSHVAQ